MDAFPFSKEDSFASLLRSESHMAGKHLLEGNFSGAKASEALNIGRAPTHPRNIKPTSKYLFLYVSYTGES